MARVCNCGSDNMKSLKAIREQYNTETKSTTIGAGIFSGGGVGAGVARTSGSLAPKIAKNIESRVPKKPGILGILVWFFLAFMFFGIGVQETDSIDGGTLYFTISVVSLLVVIAKISGRMRYSSKYDKYRRTWYCFSCGNFWVYEKRVKGST